MEDLVPRQEIASKLTDELCDKLKDKNWKIRKEGLDEVKDLVSSAKFITGDLGPLPGSLAPRTTDANKILAIQAIELIGTFFPPITLYYLLFIHLYFTHTPLSFVKIKFAKIEILRQPCSGHGPSY